MRSSGVWDFVKPLFEGLAPRVLNLVRGRVWGFGSGFRGYVIRRWEGATEAMKSVSFSGSCMMTYPALFPRGTQGVNFYQLV